MSGDSVSPQQIIVTQEGIHAKLSVSSNLINVAATGDTQTSFTVFSNQGWTLNSKYDWIKSDFSNGSDTAQIILTVRANPSINDRTDTITISGNGVASQKVIITQAAGSAVLTVSANKYFISDTSRNINFSIFSNTSWNIKSSQRWITPNSSIGSDTASLTLLSEVNMYSVQRTDTVLISGIGIKADTIFIIQEASSPKLSVSANSFIISASENNSAHFTINSNLSWTINQKQNWITPDVNFGSDTADIILSASANPFGLSRADTVVVSATGVDPQSIIVIQEANPQANIMNVENSDIKLYPVPVIDILNISLPFTADNIKILIYKPDGVEVYSSNLTESITGINLSYLSPGIYFIKINTSDNNILIRKIMKL